MFKFFCGCCGKEIQKLFFVCIVDDANIDHYFKLCKKCGDHILKELSEKSCSKKKEVKGEKEM